MSISDRNVNVRFPERGLSRIRDLMGLFERSRSWVMREGMDVFWTLMFDTDKLLPFIREWQALRGNNSQRDVTQLSLQFPRGSTGCEMFPRIWGPFSGGKQQ